MRVAAFSPAEARVIEACRDAGDFILIDCEDSDPRSERTHRCAAIAAVKAACECAVASMARTLNYPPKGGCIKRGRPRVPELLAELIRGAPAAHRGDAP